MKRKIEKALRKVIDPELGLNIVDLGLIYGIDVDEKKVEIKMTLTTPFCPLAGFLIAQVEEKLEELGYEPEVKLVFDPPWTPERMSREVRRKLEGIFRKS